MTGILGLGCAGNVLQQWGHTQNLRILQDGIINTKPRLPHSFGRQFFTTSLKSCLTMLIFEKPIGAHADCRELEYISALHQSGVKIRKDASISAEDVVNLLLSRHGIKVDLAYVEENVMPGLAGAMDESPDAVFDITELASMLLIPHLRKTAAGDDAQYLFESVLKMIALDVNGSTEPMILDRVQMKKIMQTYGEDDVSDKVIDEMLKAAGVVENRQIEFDYNVLVNATTNDVLQYDPEWETRTTTYYDDVLDGTALDANLEDNDPDEELSKSKFDEAGDKIKRVFTFPTIDFVAENYRSKTFNIFLWVLFIVVFFVYAFEFQSALGQKDCSTTFKTEFGCRVVNAIISWMIIMAQLVISGSLYIILSTAGNSIHLQHNLASLVGVLIGIATIVASCILSYVFDFKFFLINTFKDPREYFQFAYIFVVILGCFLLLFQVKALLYVLIPRRWWEKRPFRSFWLTCEMAKAECCTKRAAAYKVNNMVEHAIAQHNGSAIEQTKEKRSKLRSSTLQNGFGNAMLSFQATSDHLEQTGGVLYTFRKIWDGSLFSEEGIYIHSRLYAMNVAQVFIIIFYIILYASLDRVLQALFSTETQAPTVSPAPTFSPYPTLSPAPSLAPTTIANQVTEYAPYAMDAMYNLVYGIGENAIKAIWANISTEYPYVVQELGLDLLNYTNPETIQVIASQLSRETLAFFVEAAAFQAANNGTARSNFDEGIQQNRYLQEASTDETVDFIPTLTETRIALSVGGLAAIFAAMSLAIVWIPSSVSTIQQFRCGKIASLRDSSFQIYRDAPDLTTILFGSTFWATFYSSFTILAIVGIAVFLLVWSATRSIVIRLLANLIGIGVTFLFKFILLIVARKMLFVGFFRKRPVGGNILLLVLECWSLGLTIATMLVRLVKLIMISAFYIGRLDTPLFAPGVGMIGPMHLDAHPIQFRKDLLVHDAHRHPYIERLAVIYMLKLRYGEQFGQRAGGQWRLIFVMALMPWLRRYRLDDGPSYDDYAEGPVDADVDRGEHSRFVSNTNDKDAPAPVVDHVVDTSDDDELLKTRVFLQKATANMDKKEAKRFVEGLLFLA